MEGHKAKTRHWLRSLDYRVARLECESSSVASPLLIPPKCAASQCPLLPFYCLLISKASNTARGRTYTSYVCARVYSDGPKSHLQAIRGCQHLSECRNLTEHHALWEREQLAGTTLFSSWNSHPSSCGHYLALHRWLQVYQWEWRAECGWD